MAEIQMFQPGTAFMNSYNQAKAGSLAKIAFTEPQRRQSALADLYGLDPQAANSMKKEFDAQEQEQLKTFATAFLNTPDELKPQMYGRAKEMWRPRFQALGSDIPDDWKQAMPTIQALAGSTQAELPADIRTNEWYLKQLGYKPGSEEERNFLRMRAGQMPKAVPYGFKYDEQGNVWVEDRNQGNIRPGQFGGQNPPPEEVSQGGDPMGSYLDRIRMGGEVLAANNVPPDQINAWKDAEFAKAQQELSAKGVTFAPPAGTSTQPPQQARVSVKDQGQLTPYQEETLRLQREAAARAEAEAAAKAAERKAAADAKAKERQDRVSSAQATTDNLLDNIRQLKSHPGFKELGTLGGNAADSALPEFVPTDYRGAKARLETIKGQIALQAMAELKALSNTGATGFGALAVPELTLLQNSIQTLTTSQNNGDIMAALDQIEKLLTKAKSGQRPPAQTPSGNQPTSGKRVGRFVIEEN